MMRVLVVLSALLAACSGCCPSHMEAARAAEESLRAAPAGPGQGSTKVIAVMEGRVSYYHDSLAGNHTSNGERYDPKKLTAASRTLPFGTRVRVVRIDNGRSVVVRVNDRGPFGDRGRILDLSRAAARELEMIAAGVVEVRAEVLEGR